MTTNRMIFRTIALGLGIYLSATSIRAAVLTTLPGPMAQGGMVHIDVVFSSTNPNFSSSLEFGGAVVPEMKPLSLWNPGDTIDPTRPWYSLIDPTQQAALFSSRWGFRIDTDNSDPVPSGTSIGIRMTSATSGLGAYFYNATGNGTFQPVFLTTGSPHDYILWSGVMWHPVFTMPASTTYGSTVSATFEFFLANATNSGNVDWATTAGNATGYTIGTQTITWTAIPEPGSSLLLLAALGAWALFHRKRTGSPEV